MLSDNLSANTLRPIFSSSLSVQLETIKLDAFIQTFARGQTLTGKVVQPMPEQKAVVEFSGQKLLVQFSRPVSSGQSITVQVEQTQPHPVLKLIDSQGASPQASLKPFSKGAESNPGILADKTSLNHRGSDPAQAERTALRIPEGQAVPNEAGQGKQGVQPEVKSTELFTQNDLKRLGISPGQKVTGQVVRENGPTLLIRLPGGEVSVPARLSPQFQPGQSVTVEAKESSGGRFQFEVTGSPRFQAPVDVSLLKNYLSTRQSLTQVFSGLRDIFMMTSPAQLKTLNIDPVQLAELQANLQKLAGSDTARLEGQQVKDILDRSGLHYEARVKDFVADPAVAPRKALMESDLKGQLLRLARQLEQAPGLSAEAGSQDKWIGKVISQVNQAVSNIELQQLTQHFSREAQHPLLLQLPENLLGEADRFRIFILPDPEGQAEAMSGLEDRVFNLVFLLNLSVMGDLRIETRVLKNDISVVFKASDLNVIQFVEAHVPELEETLSQEGFSLSVFSQPLSEVDMNIPDSLGELLVDTSLQMVDVKT